MKSTHAAYALCVLCSLVAGLTGFAIGRAGAKSGYATAVAFRPDLSEREFQRIASEYGFTHRRGVPIGEQLETDIYESADGRYSIYGPWSRREAVEFFIRVRRAMSDTSQK